MDKKKLPTVKQLYQLAVELGIKKDPRSKIVLDRKFKQAKEAFEKCKKPFDKECFDQDSLWNPFADTKLLSVKENDTVSKVAFGIDIETSEILLVQKLNELGAGIDFIIAHHPEDKALLGLGGVMDLQIDVYQKEGVPENIAEKLMGPRIKDINSSVHSTNYNRASRAAKLLGLNFACIHTPCDNHAYDYLDKLLSNKKNLLVSEIIEELKKIPEFAEACRLGNPPVVVCGSEKNRAGKISITGFTGGTGGPEEIYEKLAQAGVGTILTMHISKDSQEKANKNGINVINCGHMASDSLGINLILDEFEKLGVEIVPLSGLIRYSRISKTFNQ